MSNKVSFTVYTKPGCGQCDKVKSFLHDDGVKFKEKPIDDDIMVMAKVLGIKQAPIIVYHNSRYSDHIVSSGYDVDLLELFGEEYHNEETLAANARNNG